MLRRSGSLSLVVALLLSSGCCAGMMMMHRDSHEHSSKTTKSPHAGHAAEPARAAGGIRGETLTLQRGDAQITCYLARPAGDAPAPGLLLIHEWWGLNDWVRAQAERFAKRGYLALAIDLYRGEVARDSEHAHELMRGLTDERAIADLTTAFEYVSTHSQVRGRKVGVIGWCMGGGLALKLAIAEPKLACTVVCYGRPVTDVEQLRRIRGPVLGIWGQRDRGIEVEPFRAALESAGVRATHHVFPDAGHAFLNENNARGYHAEQAAKAWEVIDGFLDAELTQ